MMGEMVLHCWEEGPRGEWGELPGSTCMLEDGHVGPHQFTPNNEIGVAFVDGSGRSKTTLGRKDLMHKVMWRPPSHQSIYAPDHPSGHDCAVCTKHYESQVVARRLTLRGAQRRADRLNDCSLTPGWFYVGEEGVRSDG